MGPVGYAILAYLYGKLTMSIDVSNIYFSEVYCLPVFVLIYTYKFEIAVESEEKKKRKGRAKP